MSSISREKVPRRGKGLVYEERGYHQPSTHELKAEKRKLEYKRF